MGRKKPNSQEKDDPPETSGGGGKSKKKTLMIDDDEYSISTEVSEEPQVQEEKPQNPTKKKGKKGSSKGLQINDDEYDLEKEIDNHCNEDPSETVFTGKKKLKSKKAVGNPESSTSSFGLLAEEDNDGGDDKESVLTIENNSEGGGDVSRSFKGKKKSSELKSKKSSGSLFTASAFDAIDDDNAGELVQNDDDEDDVPISFSGKKKKSAKSSMKDSNFFSAAAASPDEEQDEEATVSEPVRADDDPVIAFSGKKKSSKNKGSSAFAGPCEESVVDSVEVTPMDKPDQQTSASNVNTIEEAAETSKNKKNKKKKKSGRTAEEEDDLDRILAELDEGRPIVRVPEPRLQEVEITDHSLPLQDATGEREGEEETVESAAARKRKKKKEKEKEKKAAAAASTSNEEKKEEVKSEKASTSGIAAVDKKTSKKVRAMQEALAKRLEDQERQKREEEEKRKKEEEEQLRLEELERQAEEAKRRKKEREKEKLLKKKLEGKLLTRKQKEEAHKREQFLANAGGVPLPSLDKESAPSKRPKYQTKKSKPHQLHSNGASACVAAPELEKVEENKTQLERNSVPEADDTETARAQEAESIIVQDSQQVVEENGVEEDDDDDEWDAKSWDDVNLNVKSAFDDEEVDSEPEPVVKKEIKNAISAATASNEVTAAAAKLRPAAKKVIPVETQDVEKRKANEPDASVKQGEENLRSPICCIMGHVDTGKTKLLDCIRCTNVQEGEAGGITQQIGATYFPAENIRERTKALKADAKLNVPGLLVIDTPGHESFANLRSRGSGLCDIAILVVDIMHGLEPQTIESLNLLRMRNTDFIIALNKVDRLYSWKVCRNAPIGTALKQQSKDVLNEFNMRVKEIIYRFKMEGLNTELYYKNKDMGETYNIVPTSAISGEGIPDLLLLLIQRAQKTMVEKLTFSDEIECTVLEVKVVEGHGTTIDVVLVNGVLHEGNQIVVCGMQGPIVTQIRALLTPHPMKELRVKGTYVHHKEIKAAQGIKITAQGLEHAIAGTGLYVVGPNDDLETVKEAAMEDMKSVMNRIDKSGEGVYVQASTLGSLEALLAFLKTPAVNIPVSGIGIGPIHKKDVMKASVMLEKKKEYATILAFDVKVTTEARELADELGVKIFNADIIYHLFDQFKAYIDAIMEERRKEVSNEAIFPCLLKILPNCIFNKKDPIILGVDILEGIAKVGTPLCVPSQEFIDIGRIASIEHNHKPVETARKGQQVAIKIIGSNAEEQQKMFGRHFDIDDELVSHLTRESIDALKANFRDDLSLDEWRFVKNLKSLLKIQ